MNDMRWQASTDDELSVMLEALEAQQNDPRTSRTATDVFIRRDLIAYIKHEIKRRQPAKYRLEATNKQAADYWLA